MEEEEDTHDDIEENDIEENDTEEDDFGEETNFSSGRNQAYPIQYQTWKREQFSSTFVFIWRIRAPHLGNTGDKGRKKISNPDTV